MVEAQHDLHGPATPLWIRRPEVLHRVAYSVAALVFAGQIVAVIVRGSDWQTALSVLLAGGGVALSWWKPWAGLVVTSAASFAVTAVGQDPLSVWMMAVLVLFSAALRGKQPLVGTAIVAASFLGAFMTVGGFRGGAIVGAAALFSAVAGGATGVALRIHRDQWWMLEERAESAIATREIEATRRVAEERLRIARDLHDVIGHQVAMLSMHLGVAEIGLPEDCESSRQALVSARSSARTVVVETQRILALLRRGDDASAGEALRPIPALSGLEGLVASFESIGLDVRPSIDLPAVFVEPSVGMTVYRVVQEALTNAYRHGEGTATVDVREHEGRICATVENRVSPSQRGSGSGSESGSGLGLVGMRERVESSGAGANGFLSKTVSPAELVAGITEVVGGGGALSAVAAAALIGHLTDSPPPAVDRDLLRLFGALTPRERDVIVLIASGLGNDEIAARLRVSPFTVKTHAVRAMTKVGARDRAQLVSFTFRAGLYP